MPHYLPFEKRFQKELQMLTEEPVEGMSLSSAEMKGSVKLWMVNVVCPENTIYVGEKFLLQFKFSDDYPFKAPEVKFVDPNIPVNPFVYSNGDISLSILKDGWTPSLNIHGICTSIKEFLYKCQKKERPKDNDVYIEKCRKKLNKTK